VLGRRRGKRISVGRRKLAMKTVGMMTEERKKMSEMMNGAEENQTLGEKKTKRSGGKKRT
jgi:hypothetical protein